LSLCTQRVPAAFCPEESGFSAITDSSLEKTLAQNDSVRWSVLKYQSRITGYLVYRSAYPAAFHAASQHLNVVLGTVNTAILLTSSLAVALAVHAATMLNALGAPADQPLRSQRRQVMLLLLTTAGLALIFLGIKGYEYYRDYEEELIPALNFRWEGEDARHVELFFVLYFVTTGMHALHMIIGVVIALIMAFLTGRGWYDRDAMPVELFGLYWHFVDIVWIFVFPFYYLIGRT